MNLFFTNGGSKISESKGRQPERRTHQPFISAICPKKCITLRDFLCIPTPNTGQLNPLFHTFAEFRLIVNRIVAWQSTDWLAANAQFSPNGRKKLNREGRVPGTP